MKYEWDENKRLANIEKHGFDFFDADQVFDAPHLILPSRYVGSEERMLAIGLCDGRPVTVVYTIRNEMIRIISFRRARHEEKRAYCQLYQ